MHAIINRNSLCALLKLSNQDHAILMIRDRTDNGMLQAHGRVKQLSATLPSFVFG